MNTMWKNFSDIELPRDQCGVGECGGACGTAAPALHASGRVPTMWSPSVHIGSAKRKTKNTAVTASDQKMNGRSPFRCMKNMATSDALNAAINSATITAGVCGRWRYDTATVRSVSAINVPKTL